MKIKKISSTLSTFRTISFNEKFNIIVGNPSVSKKGVPHNLGKTTILKLLKFVCFDGSKDFLSSIFSRHPDTVFSVFYEKNGEEFCKQRSSARRKKNEEKNVSTIYDYTYFIRTQDELDTENGFRKPNFLGKDVLWKPRLATLLGFDGEMLKQKLIVSDEIKDLEKQLESMRFMNSNLQDREEQIRLLEKQKKEINDSIQSLLLFKSDKNDINVLVGEIDAELHEIKKEMYARETLKRKIASSLKSIKESFFDKAKIEKVFSDVGLYFEKQLVKSFEELQAFYDTLYKNRLTYLNDNKEKNEMRLNALQERAAMLDNERSVILRQLANESAIQVFEGKHSEIIEIEKQIALLKEDSSIQNIGMLETELSEKRTREFQCSADVAKDVDDHDQKFKQIAAIYSEIMMDVMKINAEMKVEKLSTGNLNFYVRSIRNGIKTEELKGDSAKKISAAAIDLAIRCVQNEDDGFIAQDGVIDCLDKNCAGIFIRKVKSLSERYHFQYIATALKEKLPEDVLPEDIVIELDDIKTENLLMGFKY